MPIITGQVSVQILSMGVLCTRFAHIIVTPAPAFGPDVNVTGTFLCNGVVVGSFGLIRDPTYNNQFLWSGMLPNGIPAGASFVARATATSSNPFLTINGSGSATATLESVLPWVTIDPFQTPKSALQMPATFVMTGGAGEGVGWPYGVSQVQYQVGNGPFINVDPFAPGVSIRWSVVVQLPTVGDTTITVRAIDPYGGIGSAQAPIRVLRFQMPSPIDPAMEKTRALQIPTTGSITSWTRLEPQVASADMGVSSNARVFDPLWFMTRQWQMGEFQGEDTGSPVQARVRATNAPLSRCVFGELSTTNSVGQPYDPRQAPLETLVERRRMRALDAGDTRMLSFAVEAGLHFLRMLDLDVKARKYRPAFMAAYLMQKPAPAAEPIDDDHTRRFIDTMVGRAPDARRLATAFRRTAPSITFDPALKIAAADGAAVQKVAVAWLDWYDSTFAEPANPTDDAWTAPRLEYAVSVAARLSPQAPDTVTLSASQFDGGRLDWSSFDVNSQLSIDTTGDAGFSSFSESTVPSPVSFAGAPAARFWEMEDAKVAYGLVPVGPTDLAHLLLIEFASTYGNDWYVIPLTTPVGSITRVDSLIVTDTFGVKRLVRPIGDPALPPPNFSMFQQSTIRYAGGAFGAPKPNCFYLPPTIARSIESPIVEDVVLMRDEMANVAWGIEKTVEGGAERPVSLTNGSASVPSNATVPSPGNAPQYLLSSTVPTNWIPLLPVQVIDHGALVSRLKRGAMLQPDGTNATHHAQSEALTLLGTSLLFDEEVPREGTHITRRRRMVRWTDGSSWVWTAFRNDVGTGEGSSALQFDQLRSSHGSPL